MNAYKVIIIISVIHCPAVTVTYSNLSVVNESQYNTVLNGRCQDGYETQLKQETFQMTCNPFGSWSANFTCNSKELQNIDNVFALGLLVILFCLRIITINGVFFFFFFLKKLQKKAYLTS